MFIIVCSPFICSTSFIIIKVTLTQHTLTRATRITSAPFLPPTQRQRVWHSKQEAKADMAYLQRQKKSRRKEKSNNRARKVNIRTSADIPKQYIKAIWVNQIIGEMVAVAACFFTASLCFVVRGETTRETEVTTSLRVFPPPAFSNLSHHPQNY